MWKAKWSRFTECFCRRPRLVLVTLPGLLIVTLYLISGDDYWYENLQYPFYKFDNDVEDTLDGFLVWNSKCHMPSKDPLDPTIVKFVKKERYEACSNGKSVVRLSKETNGSSVLFVDPEAAAVYRNLSCCWSAVIRPRFEKPKDKFDSTIMVKQCQNIKDQAIIPPDVEVVVTSCSAAKGKSANKTVHKNVHAILNVEKVHDRLESNLWNASLSGNSSRKLGILFLGIDSVSRLNLKRSMPETEKYLNETGWVSMKGYNKMGDNTFPNLMAILTGQNQSQAYKRCKPTVAYNLDRCPFLWHSFRNAGYVTAYGEDETILNTFNYLKVGFVDPPTDYYLRPYMLASEKLLDVKKRFSLKYCTGPELSFERIFDYAMNFASAFVGTPYFGFFWTNSISHDNMNGPSSMDPRILKKFKYLESAGVLNDTMVVFLSDHGMRYSGIRNTFVGWYEERLPFLYIWLPAWFRAEYPEAYRALRVNENRLTSPFDLYETLRDILRIAGGSAIPSSGCGTCQTLFEPVPKERSCQEAGVAPHWCTCTAFTPASTGDDTIIAGAEKFVEHVNNATGAYKDKKGKRLCASLRLKRIHRVDRVLDFGSGNSTTAGYFYLIQTKPGDGKFEVTIRHHGNGSYTIFDEEVSRINSYASSAKCLERGMKQYCYCVK